MKTRRSGLVVQCFIKRFLGYTGLIRHGAYQVLAKRRFWTVYGNFIKFVIISLNPLFVRCSLRRPGTKP